MGKKKKDPPPKVHNTRSVKKEDDAVIKEQMASWWDKLISGEIDKKNEKQDVKAGNGSDETVRVQVVCELNRSTSTIPTVSTVKSSPVQSESVLNSAFESSGSSYSVGGESSVNSSPSVRKIQDGKSIESSKNVSVYDILEYEKRNIPIPVNRDLSDLLTPVKEPLTGKSEYEVWMMRRDSSVEAAKNSGLENDIVASPVEITTSEFLVNDGIRDDDDRECSVTGAENVKLEVPKNPKDSEPLDENNQQSSVGVGPEVEPEAAATGMRSVSPINVSPDMNNSINKSPTVESPKKRTALPSAAVPGLDVCGLQGVGPFSNDESLKICEPADKAQVQKKVTFSDMVMKGVSNLSPHVVKFGNFETCISFSEDMPDSDPLRGTKYWNRELFQRLLNGEGVVDGETRLAYDAPKRNKEGVFEVNIEGANMPFWVVKENVIKMWHKYGLKSINVNRGGYLFFKFDHEEGMLHVLERNPCLIDNMPLVLQMWDPNVVLSKPNPTSVPVWVAIKDLPLSLWNGGNIGQVVSCFGKPIMLDQSTFKRCELKEGPLNFARVLVDASASNGLPDKVKINLPKCDGIPGKSYFLDLSYKWKPPCCSVCKVFGHVDEKCSAKKVMGQHHI
ncbi:putative transcription factor interactor and regulator CCHC(Zn) family [Helianthus annuus]|nr:putative transcription factor interactor and regulator CCHC(Zn) family [Helianthus annuus]